MNLKSKNKLLGMYDLMLAVGAVYTGVLMISSNSGVFETYPAEWLNKTPFHSWVIPGIIFLLFGLGNITASIAGFIMKGGKAWIISGFLGTAFLFCLIVQIILLNEWYLATVELMILSLTQLALSLFSADIQKITKAY